MNGLNIYASYKLRPVHLSDEDPIKFLAGKVPVRATCRIWWRPSCPRRSERFWALRERIHGRSRAIADGATRAISSPPSASRLQKARAIRTSRSIGTGVGGGELVGRRRRTRSWASQGPEVLRCGGCRGRGGSNGAGCARTANSRSVDHEPTEPPGRPVRVRSEYPWCWRRKPAKIGTRSVGRHHQDRP